MVDNGDILGNIDNLGIELHIDREFKGVNDTLLDRITRLFIRGKEFIFINFV